MSMSALLVGVAFGAVLSWAIGVVIVCLFLDGGNDGPGIYPPY